MGRELDFLTFTFVLKSLVVQSFTADLIALGGGQCCHWAKPTPVVCLLGLLHGRFKVLGERGWFFKLSSLACLWLFSNMGGTHRSPSTPIVRGLDTLICHLAKVALQGAAMPSARN